jgi:hypothetical protein
MVQSRHACGRVRPQGGAGAREQPLARARPASVGRPEEGRLPALRSREVWRRDWYMRVQPYAGPSSSASMDIDRGNLVWHITSFDAARARALWHRGRCRANRGVGPTGGQAKGAPRRDHDSPSMRSTGKSDGWGRGGLPATKGDPGQQLGRTRDRDFAGSTGRAGCVSAGRSAAGRFISRSSTSAATGRYGISRYCLRARSRSCTWERAAR